jgi:ribosome-binding factor A
MSIRTERVASLIKEEIAGLLIKEYSGQGMGFTTVTEVQVSGDLRVARVFFSVFGSPEVQQKTIGMLEAEKSRIRGIIAPRLSLRFVPELVFTLDGTMDRVDRINRLINEIHKDDAGPGGDTRS